MATPTLEGQNRLRYVLIVDDEEKLGRFISIVLKQIGYIPVACQSVAEARKQLDTRDWDLVITDIVMPRESGFDLMRWVSSHYPIIPVIAMTAHTTEAIENQLPKLGFSEVVYKPFTIDTMRQAVQRVVPLQPTVEMAH
ncbi:MAG: response regulator [Chloroflexi bacterium]|nr:response regulator [Chloroflexota bacterium]